MVFNYLKGINLERYKSYLNEKNLKFSISGALLLIFSLEFSSVLLGLIFNNQLSNNNFNNSFASNELPRVIDNPFSSDIEIDGLSIYESLVKAPETSLSLKLYGITSSDEVKSAIIGFNQNDQKTYLVGDMISDSVYLDSINKDFITIKRSGITESLSFFKGSVITGMERVVQGNTSINIAANEKKSTIDKEWIEKQEIAKLITFAPVFDDGTFSGLEISPGENTALFDSSELRPGDIVKSINGLSVAEIDLSDQDSINSFFSDLASLNLDLIRDDQVVSVDININ
jgi:type II secretion system protein C